MLSTPNKQGKLPCEILKKSYLNNPAMEEIRRLITEAMPKIYQLWVVYQIPHKVWPKYSLSSSNAYVLRQEILKFL